MINCFWRIELNDESTGDTPTEKSEELPPETEAIIEVLKTHSRMQSVILGADLDTESGLKDVQILAAAINDTLDELGAPSYEEAHQMIAEAMLEHIVECGDPCEACENEECEEHSENQTNEY